MKSAFLKLFSGKALKKAQGKKTLAMFKIHIYLTPGLVECKNGCIVKLTGQVVFL